MNVFSDRYVVFETYEAWSAAATRAGCTTFKIASSGMVGAEKDATNAGAWSATQKVGYLRKDVVNGPANG